MDEQPLSLDFKEQPNPPPRPSRRDKAICRAAAEACLDGAIIAWAGKDYKPDDREEWINDLASVIDLGDAYDAARDLERSHWKVNFELCEILDGSWIWDAEDMAVRSWVAANLIKPKFEIGAIVTTSRDRGEIVLVDEERATYVIQTEKFLAENPDQVGRAGGYVIAFENVTLPKET